MFLGSLWRPSVDVVLLGCIPVCSPWVQPPTSTGPISQMRMYRGRRGGEGRGEERRGVERGGEGSGVEKRGEERKLFFLHLFCVIKIFWVKGFTFYAWWKKKVNPKCFMCYLTIFSGLLCYILVQSSGWFSQYLGTPSIKTVNPSKSWTGGFMCLKGAAPQPVQTCKRPPAHLCSVHSLLQEYTSTLCRSLTTHQQFIHLSFEFVHLAAECCRTCCWGTKYQHINNLFPQFGRLEQLADKWQQQSPKLIIMCVPSELLYKHGQISSSKKCELLTEKGS